ncbi:MAG: hypothetical protein DMG14_13025 [Acidobacteria bacterium]|nr:MAG: hypothetical protein DMG14_13025 [Acidobacteriota bacterium]
MLRQFRILRLILREMLTRERITRSPERAAMDIEESVEAFHAEGESMGRLRPLYHFNALAMSHLLPPEARLIDLGCGSGQYLLYLAECRPDIQIIGLDVSERMIQLGNRSVERGGFTGRVTLQLGDMTHFKRQVPDSVDVISSVFSLHHLPTVSHLRRCLKEIECVASVTGCAVWLFDHVRPRHPGTAEEFPSIFTPQASPVFQQDSRNSLRAAFSFSELAGLLDENPVGPWHHTCSKLLRLYQAHWLERPTNHGHTGHALFLKPALSGQGMQEFRQLRQILRVPFLDRNSDA